jgi:5-methylcytosine-specific restriction endonuclease McrA
MAWHQVPARLQTAGSNMNQSFEGGVINAPAKKLETHQDLRFSFDTNVYRLGKLCIHGHRWPGTDKSLRRNYDCMGCNGRQASNWLISFVDYEASNFPPGKKLGKLCHKQHRWNELEVSLRYIEGHCCECERERSGRVTKEERTKWYQKYKEKHLEEIRQRDRARRKEGAQRDRSLAYKKATRDLNKANGLTSRGSIPVRPEPSEVAMRKAIRNAGKLPSVQQLVAMEQRAYWKINPTAKRQALNAWAKERSRLRYMIDEEFRLYNRSKSKKRKAKEKNCIGLHVTGTLIKRRFMEFSKRCAYCGSVGDLHIEHFIPISKGGTHVLGNILPACPECNYAKGVKEAEGWYRAMPFFTERRWAKIKKVLGIGNGSALQIPFL